MNEEAVEVMYSLAQNEGYTDSKEDFLSLLAENSKALGTMYDLAQKNGYADNLASFEILMGLKKKEEQAVTESVSEGGLSEQQFATRQPEAEALAAYTSSIPGYYDPESLARPYENPAEAARRDSVMDLYDTRAAAALEEETKRRELEAIEISRSLPTISIPEGDRSSVLSELSAQYGRYGIQFKENYREVRPGISVLESVTAFGNAPDRTNVEMTLTLDEDGNIPVSESGKLDSFIRQNAERIPTVDETLAQQALRAREMRTVPRITEDEVSTVKMADGNYDGKFVAYPTLFPKDPTNYGTNPDDWMELDFGIEAFDEAMRRNEVFYFDTQQEARDFAMGNWKTIDHQELTFENMWGDMGRSYWADQSFLGELDARREEFLFLEELPGAGLRYEEDKFGTPVEEIPEEYKQYFIDGNMVRDDIDTIIEQKRSELQGLEDRFDDDDVLLGLKEKRDEMLNERYRELSDNAAQINRDANVAQNQLEARSLMQFGMRLEDLGDYQPQTEAELNNLIGIYNEYNKTANQKQFAALAYERAQTFYNRQHDKALIDGYTEGWEEVSVAWNNGWKRGEAMSLLLLMQMGYYDAIGDPEGEKEAMREVSEIMDSMDPRTGRIVSRANATGTSNSFVQSLAKNPLLYTTAITAESLGQLLPLWRDVALPMGVAGAAIGTGAGLLPGTAFGAVGGFLGGAAIGTFNVGMPLSELALEMGNAVLDTGERMGYDWSDPNSALLALEDKEMWSRATERGLERGIPIAGMGALSNYFIGKAVGQTSAIASTAQRLARGVGTGLVVEPVTEGIGETLALMTSGEYTGSVQNYKEIAAESIGAIGMGIGMGSAAASFGIMKRTVNNKNFELAVNLMRPEFLAKETASNTRVVEWANKMKKLGKITAEQAQYIIENVGFRRQANELLGLKPDSRPGKNPVVMGRLMRLLEAKAELESSGKGVFTEKIKEITEEIAMIAETGKVQAAGANLLPIKARIEGRRPGSYKLNGKNRTKQEFIDGLEKASLRQLRKAKVFFDLETSLKLYDAIQKRKAEKVPIRKRAGFGKEVDEEVSLEPITQEELDAKAEDRLNVEREKYIVAQIAEKVLSGEDLSEIENQYYERYKDEVDLAAQELKEYDEQYQAPDRNEGDPYVGGLNEDYDPDTQLDKKQRFVRRQAQRAVASMRERFPQVKLILHSNEERYQAEYSKSGGVGTTNAPGFYSWNDKAIHINLSSKNLKFSTVPHEAFHAILRNSIGSADVAALMQEFVVALRKVIPADSDLARDLDKFQAMYETKAMDEEFVAEFFGRLTAAYPTMNRKGKTVIARFLERLGKLIGFEVELPRSLTARDKKVLELLETLSGKVAAGEAISKREQAEFGKLRRSLTTEPDADGVSEQKSIEEYNEEYANNPIYQALLTSNSYEDVYRALGDMRATETFRQNQNIIRGFDLVAALSALSQNPNVDRDYRVIVNSIIAKLDEAGMDEFNRIPVVQSKFTRHFLGQFDYTIGAKTGTVDRATVNLSNPANLPDGFKDFDTMAETLIHEAIHVVSGLDIAYSPSGNAAEFIRLTRLIRKWLNQRENRALILREHPDFVDRFINRHMLDEATLPHELVTYGLTNRAFQDVLKLIPDPDAPTQTLWNRFVNTIREILGLSNKEATALDSILYAYTDSKAFLVGQRIAGFTGAANYQMRSGLELQRFNEDGLPEVRVSEQMGMEEATPEWMAEAFKEAEPMLRDFFVALAEQPGVRMFLNPIGGGFWYMNNNKGSTEIDVLTSIYMRDGGVYLDLLEVVAGEKGRGAGTRFMEDFVAALDATNAESKLMAWPPRSYQQGMSDEEMRSVSNRLMRFYGRFGFTPIPNSDSMTRQPGAAPVEVSQATRRVDTRRNEILEEIADKRTKQELLGNVIAQTYEVYENKVDPEELRSINERVDPYEDGVNAIDLMGRALTQEQIEAINDEYGSNLINEEGFAESFEDFMDSDIVDDYYDLVVEERENRGRLRNVERQVKEEDETAARRERRLGELEDKGMALEHILAVNEAEYGRTETDVYNEYEQYLEGRLDEADKEYLRSLRLGIDVNTGRVDNANDLYDVFSELQDVRLERNDLESGISEQRSIETDGTGINLEGNEEVQTGELSPTVLDNQGNLVEDFRLDDAEATIVASNSAAVGAAKRFASGKIRYNKYKKNPKTGKRKKIVMTVQLPYQNKKAAALLTRRQNAVKNAKGAAKRQAAMARLRETTVLVLNEFVDAMAQNVLAVYDTLTPEFVAASKEWYIGANRTANELARMYNLTVEQAAAVLAVLSPQNEWFNNIAVAERTIEVMTNHLDTPFSEDIFNKAVAKNSPGGKPSKWAKDLARAYASYGGMSLNEMEAQGVPLSAQGLLLRAIDQALYPGKVAMTTPDGDFFAFDSTPIRWSSPDEIAKAIQAFRNPDIESIRRVLGNGNKVRNFYNNIVDPRSPNPYVTADTHASAVALSTPMSSEDASAIGLFDGGQSMLYMVIKEAYIKAAEIAGIQPREMQSITWEAVRTGLNNKDRSQAEIKKNASKLAALVEDESMTPYERARRIIIDNPTVNPGWADQRGIQAQIPDLREGVRERAEPRASEVLSLRGRTGRDVGDTGAGVGARPTGDGAVDQAGAGVSEQRTIDSTNGTFLIPVESDVSSVAQVGFDPKSETHLTIIGFPNGRKVMRAIKQNPAIEQGVNRLIARSDFRFTPTGRAFEIEKDYPGHTRQALIEEVEMPGLARFYGELSELIGEELAVPYPHISLGTRLDPRGIGINSVAEFEALNPKPVTLPQNITYVEQVPDPNQDFAPGTRKVIRIGGGRIEIAGNKGLDRYGIIELFVPEDQRRQGIGTQLVAAAIEEADGKLAGMASKDAAVTINYNLGMRYYKPDGTEATLEETKRQRAENSYESIFMTTPEARNAPRREGVSEQRNMVYHVTFEENAEGIRNNGLMKDRPGTFERKTGGQFDTAGKTFAFEDLTDALAWAQESKDMFPGRPLALVAVRRGNKVFEKDPSVFLGSGVFTQDEVTKDDIVSVEPLAQYFRALGTPMEGMFTPRISEQRTAPNGRPSNLNEVQYDLVRTPEFKEWFGDWEEAYRTDNYDGVSKIIDENGEPMVMYHGSIQRGITEFTEEGADRGRTSGLREYGVSFTSVRDLAQGYAKGRAERVFQMSPEYRPDVDVSPSVYAAFLKIDNPFVYDAKLKFFPHWMKDIPYMTLSEGLRYGKSGRAVFEAVMGGNDIYDSPYDGAVVENVNDINDTENGFQDKPRLTESTGTLVQIPFSSEPTIKLADGSNTTFSSASANISEQRAAPEQPKPTPAELKRLRSPEFKAWFGDWENDPENASKVVDANGFPLKVYHAGPSEIDVFYYDRTVGGFFFSPSFEDAKKFGERYAMEKGLLVTPYVGEYYLNIRDPKVYGRFDYKFSFEPEPEDSYSSSVLKVETEAFVSGKPLPMGYGRRALNAKLMQQGIDGINILQPDWYQGMDFTSDSEQWVAFYPNSIKKPDAKSFDELSPSVSEQRAALDAMSDPDDSMIDIVRKGREALVTDEAIVGMLIRRYGRKNLPAIRKAMDLNTDLFTVVPEAFGNVEGGMLEGRQIFDEVRSELKTFMEGEQEEVGDAKNRKRIIDELREEHPEWKDLSDTQVLRRRPKIPPTKAEVRAEAKRLLENNARFQQQKASVQDALLIAFDSSLNTRANKNVQNLMSQIRRDIRQRKRGARERRAVQRNMRALIREVLPATDYNKTTINRLLRILNDVNEENFYDKMSDVMSEVEKARERMRIETLKKIQKLVARAAKTTRTQSGRVRTRGLDAPGQAFFAQAKLVLDALQSKKPEAMDDIIRFMEESQSQEYQEALLAYRSGLKMTRREQELIDRMAAFDLFSDLNGKNLEETQAILEDLLLTEGFSRVALKQQRLANARRASAIRDEVAGDIRSNYSTLILNENGEPMNDNEIGAKRSQIRKLWESDPYKSRWERLGDLMSAMRQEGAARLARRGSLVTHLGTYTSIMGEYIFENIYRAVNEMEEKYLRGLEDVMRAKDEIASSIEGIESFADIGRLIFSTTEKVRLKTNGMTRDYHIDELMRIYALSMNPVQREKLMEQGFTDKVMGEIKAALGPQLTEFAEKITDYLGGYYYEGINDVYSELNNVNLPHVENYFPTRSLTTESVTVGQAQNIMGYASAQTASALKERTNLKGPVLLGAEGEGIGFVTSLDNHFRSMERFKAYALGTRDINTIMSTPEFRALLRTFRGNGLMNLLVNQAVDPEKFISELKGMSKVADWFVSRYTMSVLFFKAWQMVKQASSFVMAFSDYKYKPDSNAVQDLIMFGVDAAELTVHTLAEMATFGKYKGPVADALNLSASFRNRYERAMRGEIYSLESGIAKVNDPRKAYQKHRRLYQELHRVGGRFTALGDLAGVMGYMVNYRRDIKNGMDPEQAMLKFNDYNMTQQSRRPADRVPIQIYQNGLTRMLIAFMSTSILYLNNTLRHANNIARSRRKGEKVSAKDIRGFMLNAFFGHMIYQATANMMMLLQGDDDDRLEFAATVGTSPFANLYSLPIIGDAIETVINEMTGKKYRTTIGVNPFERPIKDAAKSIREEEYGKAVVDAAAYAVGANTNFLEAASNIAQGHDVDENLYELFGIPKSQRPE